MSRWSRMRKSAAILENRMVKAGAILHGGFVVSMKAIVLTLSTLLIIGVLGACSAAVNEEDAMSRTTETEGSQQVVKESAQANEEGASIVSEASVMDFYDWTFTNRDIDPSYDASEAVDITLADKGTVVEGDGVTVEGSKVTISKAGIYVVTGSLSDGSLVVDLPGKEDKVQLVLAGMSINNETSAAILVENADKVFITLADGSSNTLSDGSSHVLGDDENDHDGVIFSHEDLTLNGTGSLTVEAEYMNGIVGKDDVRITGGIYTVDAVNHGIQGKDCLKILDGTFAITSGQDALHASNDEDATLGYLGIGGGSFSLAAGDDAIHANSALLIAGGTIDISESYEGLEGKTVSIAGGVTTVVSSDDAVNASEGSTDENDVAAGSGDMSGGVPGDMPGGGMDMATEGCYIEIVGGVLYATGGGDCLDSNGDLFMSGGDVIAVCTASGGDAALDYDGTASITGGTIIALGPKDMVQGFGSQSTQASILVTGSSTPAKSAYVEIQDSTGTTIHSATFQNAGVSWVFSSPELVGGQTYSIVCDGVEIGSAQASLDTNGISGMGGRPQGEEPPGGNVGGEPGVSR